MHVALTFRPEGLLTFSDSPLHPSNGVEMQGIHYSLQDKGFIKSVDIGLAESGGPTSCSLQWWFCNCWRCASKCAKSPESFCKQVCEALWKSLFFQMWQSWWPGAMKDFCNISLSIVWTWSHSSSSMNDILYGTTPNIWVLMADNILIQGPLRHFSSSCYDAQSFDAQGVILTARLPFLTAFWAATKLSICFNGPWGTLNQTQSLAVPISGFFPRNAKLCRSVV